MAGSGNSKTYVYTDFNFNYVVIFNCRFTGPKVASKFLVLGKPLRSGEYILG